MTLYDDLRRLEQARKSFDRTWDDAEALCEKYGGHVERPRFNEKSRKKNLIAQHRGNPVLADALEGRVSLTESYEDLRTRYSHRKLIPRMKNAAYNERLGQFGEIVMPVWRLKTGLLDPFGTVPQGMATTAGVLLLAHPGIKAMGFGPIFEEAPELVYGLMAYCSLAGGVFAGLLNSVDHGEACYRSKYLDDTINAVL